MAVGKEIRSKIKSIQSTQKITRAMQMVATSKMRKTQERMHKARPYAEKIRQVMLSLASSNISHPMIKKDQKNEEIKNAGIILVTTDKGLCAGLNTNAIRLFYQTIQKLEKLGVKTKACCIGQKGLIASKRVGIDITSSITHISQPRADDLIGVASSMIKEFATGEIDKLFVVYSRFINTMKQEACIEQLLPIELKEEKKQQYSWSHLYEPEAEEVLDFLIKRYTESVIYQVVVENAACEQAARMIAMKSATDNAQSVINHLQLTYNKARQAAITTELTEIVAGAAAV